MNREAKQREKTIQRTTTGLAMLVLGMFLLILGGMNLFTNVLQVWNGEWQQNFLMSAFLAVLFSAIPALIGGWMVYRATADITPQISQTNDSK